MNRYLVWCPEHSATIDDARVFEAFDHQAAAEAWAEHEDRTSADYLIVGDKWTPTVHVKAEGDDAADTIVFKVSGYTVAEYTARPA